MKEVIDSAEWVVQRIRHDRRRLTVILSVSDAPAPWIAMLRRLVPELVSQAPANLLDQVRQNGQIELGVMTGRDAYRINKSLRSNGFEVTIEDASDVVLFPVNRAKGFATIIENTTESDAFCRELIANGAPIQEVEA